MPKPDNIEPILRPDDVKDSFDKSGLRVPMIVVSPWVKKNFVSHTPRDFTAILKFIQERFDLPALTERDKAQPSMQEFFDFTTPSWMTPPPLPEQPAQSSILGWNDPGAGVCDFKLETAP
jgi:phospholipase C